MASNLRIKMNQRQVCTEISSFFPFTPTSGQEIALEKLASFVLESEDAEVFVLKGYAGTGKTSLMSAFIRYLERKNTPCVLLAPTGRAAKVLARYSGQHAATIHKTIYRKDGRTEEGGFSLQFNKYKHAFFIVDEASMISNDRSDSSPFGSGHLLEDLLEFVYTGDHCRLILMGDTAQLPPVGQELSPALDASALRQLGVQAYGTELTQVLRQSEVSGILANATRLREHIRLGEVHAFPKLRANLVDVIRLTGDDLLEAIATSWSRVGMDESKIVCYSNKRAVIYNKGVRQALLYREEELSSGDFLMVARNNYLWSAAFPEIPFIANGDLVEVVRVRKQYEMYGLRFADVEMRFPDYEWEMEGRVVLDSLESESPALGRTEQERLYQEVAFDYSGQVKTKRELYQAMKTDPWLNALQVKYGYAFTCHKAQGGQWKDVFIDQGFVREDRMGLDYYRWLYTALTRATERIYLVNFLDAFLDEVPER